MSSFASDDVNLDLPRPQLDLCFARRGDVTVLERRRFRWPFVLTWSLAQIPNAVSFGIVATVTTELFTGSNGIGGILITAIDTANADLTFAVVILLGVVSVVLIFAAERVKRFLLRWQ